MSSLHLLGGLARDLAKDVTERLKGTPRRRDDGLPLGLRHGGMVSVSDITGLLLPDAFNIPADMARDLGFDPQFLEILALKAALPQGPHAVQGWSRTPWHGLWLYRFHLSDDAGFLEVWTEADGLTVLDDGIRFFSLLAEEFPLEWNDWTPDPQGSTDIWWIGNAAYPLPGLSLDDDGDWVAWSYQRMWSPGDTVIAPREMREEVCLDPFEDGAKTVIRHECMLYARRSPRVTAAPDREDGATEALEYLFLTAAETSDGKGVEFWAGIGLSPADLTII